MIIIKTNADNTRYLPQSGKSFVFYALLPKRTCVVNRAVKHTTIYRILYVVK